jgi:hypothetical protein
LHTLWNQELYQPPGLGPTCRRERLEGFGANKTTQVDSLLLKMFIGIVRMFTHVNKMLIHIYI